MSYRPSLADAHWMCSAAANPPRLRVVVGKWCSLLCLIAMGWLPAAPVAAQVTERPAGTANGDPLATSPQAAEQSARQGDELVAAQPPGAGGRGGMISVSKASVLVGSFTVFLLAVFVGFEIITKVPPTLHTPLMSGSNAISGITVVGAMLTAGAAAGGFGSLLGLLAVVLATVNVVGGFLVTHRMLKMFKKR